MTSRSSRSKGQTVTGEVFTRRMVVDHMLHEVAFFGQIRQWMGLRVLEPSCGEGAFVLPLVELLVSEVVDWNDSRLDDFLCACDISKSNVEKTGTRCRRYLIDSGCPPGRATKLVAKWFVQDDFLLHDFTGSFDVVIGNPPYIRFDDLSERQQQVYKRRYETFSERCDIYVPFFERALSLLSDTGVFSFICSNRFAKSSYGKRLRTLISNRYHVALYLNMEHTQPFEEEVSAYPAIYVIDRRIGAKTWSTTIDEVTEQVLVSTRASSGRLSEFTCWYRGEEPWISTDVDQRDFAMKIARTFPVVERSARETRIGIGVATGADDLYVDVQKTCAIESDCLLPLVTADEITAGRIESQNRFVLNPYDENNDTLMRDLSRFPKLAAYLESHAERLKGRYCARKHPDSWYRTLDRISYRVLKSPKLLLPDIQSGGNVALDEEGKYYPHHNVYWITSEGWNLRALCVLMRSSFVTNQVRGVSLEMRGGFIRYQAQNLRQVHIPHVESLTQGDVERLVALYEETDAAKVDRVVDAIVRRAASRRQPVLVQAELFAVDVQRAG